MKAFKKENFYRVEVYDAEADRWYPDYAEHKYTSFDNAVVALRDLTNGYDAANEVVPPARIRFGSVVLISID